MTCFCQQTSEDRVFEFRREEFYKQEIESLQGQIESMKRHLAEQRAEAERWHELASKYLVTREVLARTDDTIKGRLMVSALMVNVAKDPEIEIRYQAMKLAEKMIRAMKEGVG